MKSPLQIRAELAAKNFTSYDRKPIVIEFAGMPKAGKTTTLSNILEKTQDPPASGDPQILILDRGLFDSICWLQMMERLERLHKCDREIIDEFLRILDWRKRITVVIVMTASAEDALEREKGALPVEGVIGSIMNTDVLNKNLENVISNISRLKDEFNIFHIDTSASETRNNPKKTCEIIVEYILNLIEDQIQEDILCIKKEKVIKYFKKEISIDNNLAFELIKDFIKIGKFYPRKNIETDSTNLQALPIVVIRNKTGDILQLKRRERSKENILNEKVVIWAGGHVRKEDSNNGNPIIQCIMRELREELRLCIEENELKLLGAVYADYGKSTSKHVGIIYEWVAKTDDVAIVLSNEEFIERRGTSMSGNFSNILQIAKDVDKGEISEIWSEVIMKEFLLKGKYDFQTRLFQ